MSSDRGPLVVDGVIVRHDEITYSNLKCRCRECRAAWADYTWQLRRDRAEALKRDPSLAEHGTESTYTNWCCRCNDCLRAWVAARRRRYEARKAKS